MNTGGAVQSYPGSDTLHTLIVSTGHERAISATSYLFPMLALAFAQVVFVLLTVHGHRGVLLTHATNCGKYSSWMYVMSFSGQKAKRKDSGVCFPPCHW